MIFFEILSLVLSLLFLYLFYRFIKGLFFLVIHSIGALLLLFLVNFLFSLSIPISVLSFLVVLFGGIPGLLLILLLHFLNLAF
ncbi:pro-sigmaK processing inhibitor BofA family protein [Candidatus Micrarchaeota archaeon]|nr:pro-sigmaK processing inhibitor BofA family protein [Candidatus Micrarchaeota archaeon]